MAKKMDEPNKLQLLKEELRQGAPARLYFFYGEEVFLLHHYLKQLRKHSSVIYYNRGNQEVHS